MLSGLCGGDDLLGMQGVWSCQDNCVDRAICQYVFQRVAKGEPLFGGIVLMAGDRLDDRPLEPDLVAFRDAFVLYRVRPGVVPSGPAP